MGFIFQQFLFFVAIALVLFAPGYFLILAIWGKKKTIADLEKLVVSFGASIILVDFIMLAMGKAGILFTRVSLILAIIIFFAACYSVYFIRERKFRALADSSDTDSEKNPAFNFSKNQKILIILILFLTVFIKTIFLTDTISPTATDLGHHMYWTKSIMETGELPVYQKSDIIDVNGRYEISEPQKIDDFIIGEHLIFAALGLISGSDVMSSFPSLVLLLINIMGILAIFILAGSFFRAFSYGKNLSIIILFFLGPIYALSAPQANYVSGGVIGNLIGNLLIPIAFYLLLRGITEKNTAIFSFGLFAAFGLLYTHHLSAFIFAAALCLSAAILLILQWKRIVPELKKWAVLIFSPPVLSFIAVAVIFFFFIHMPSYIENQAVKTVIGEPSRTTKEGLPVGQLQSVVGESRAAFGAAGVIVAVLILKSAPYQSAIILGWLFSVLIMSWKPSLIHIDIPSVRIANYLIFPLSLSGSLAASWFFFDYLGGKKKEKIYPALGIYLPAAALLIAFLVTGGFFDNSNSLKDTAEANGKAVETFAVSRYLSERVGDGDLILKDHNYVSADSWMKLFFMRDYNFPLTRGYFFRYDSSKKEKCTLQMIAVPDLPEANKCYNETGVNFIVINPNYDSAQFGGSEQFWKVYSSNNIETYYRPIINRT